MSGGKDSKNVEEKGKDRERETVNDDDKKEIWDWNKNKKTSKYQENAKDEEKKSMKKK